jgi:hypothetical protein
MLTPEERALLTETQDRLIDLLVQQDEAKTAEDWDRVRDLKAEIEDVQDELKQISCSETL